MAFEKILPSNDKIIVKFKKPEMPTPGRICDLSKEAVTSAKKDIAKVTVTPCKADDTKAATGKADDTKATTGKADSTKQAPKKPIMRGLLRQAIKRNLAIALTLSVASGVATKVLLGDVRKKRYADYYRNYDAEKEFEDIRKKGHFDSC